LRLEALRVGAEEFTFVITQEVFLRLEILMSVDVIKAAQKLVEDK
jgi:hypothetical protein